MSYGYGGWKPYVPVAKRRRQTERTVEKLRKKGQSVAPVTIEGRRIATSFWGRAWCDTIESYHDYAYRLERGRSYVRNGAVVDLQIAPGQITALVNGSTLYRTTVIVAPTPPAKWHSICADCTGRIESLVELLQGRFSKPVMERLCSQESGLFPRPSEIRFTCSCPDHASMCKHVAAVLYGIGARLDQSPELLFRLRAVDETALLADLGAALPRARKGPEAGKTLVGDDLAALFGLDIAEGGAPTALPLPEAALLAPRKVAAKGTAAQIAFAKTAPARGKPAQKTKAAPTKAAQNKTTAARTRAKAKREASKKATTAGRKPPAKSLASMQAAAPSCLQSGPVIGNSTPVREFRSRRPVRSATRKRPIGSNGREPRGEA
jgi:uncharacterized Zn finger protein